MNGRIAIFIDGGYLSRVLKAEFNEPRISFSKLSEKIAVGQDILRAYYYYCLPYQSNPPTKEESSRFAKTESFLAGINRLPHFEVKLGKLAFRGTQSSGAPIFEQKRVDVLLAVDLVQLSATRQIGTAGVLTGDSDFVPAIQIAKNNGAVVRLIHGDRANVHNELWDVCDERTQIDKAFIDSIRL